MVAQEIRQSHLGLEPPESLADAIMGTDAERHEGVRYEVGFVGWRKAFRIEAIGMGIVLLRIKYLFLVFFLIS